MDRRTFLGTLAGGLLAAPRASEAQQTERVYHIGLLEVLPAASNATNLAAFHEGLASAGYIEGRNLVIEYRSADGRAERFPKLAGDLVCLKVDVIVTRGTPAALAAKRATSTIPIVMASSGDPLGTGIAASLAHPGGNITGLSAFATEIQAKQLEVLREMVPRAVHVGFLFNMSNPVVRAEWREVEAVARTMRLEPRLLDVRTGRDLERALDASGPKNIQAVVVAIDALTQSHRAQIIAALARQRLPAISREREFAEAGGLLSYGIHYADLYRHAAGYVDRIFKGAKPADLPIAQPTKFELVINLKTAKALGLTIPPSLLAGADQVIE